MLAVVTGPALARDIDAELVVGETWEAWLGGDILMVCCSGGKTGGIGIGRGVGVASRGFGAMTGARGTLDLDPIPLYAGVKGHHVIDN